MRANAVPATKTARQARVAAVLRRRAVRSQGELARLLAEEGVQVTQATLSRDLDELGVVRLRAADGSLVYVLPGEGGERLRRMPTGEVVPEGEGRLARYAQELLISAESSANLVVVRTPPGAAQFFAGVIDNADWPAILGTVAGDDTVLVIAREPDGGAEVARRLLRMAERRS